MNEGINTNPNPKEQQQREDAEQLADYLTRHPEPVISKENLREAGPEIVEFEDMIALFESMHHSAIIGSIVPPVLPPMPAKRITFL